MTDNEHDVVEKVARAIAKEMGITEEVDTTFWKCRRKEAHAAIAAYEGALENEVKDLTSIIDDLRPKLRKRTQENESLKQQLEDYKAILNDLVYLDKSHPAELADDPEYLTGLIITIAQRAKSKLTQSALAVDDKEG